MIVADVAIDEPQMAPNAAADRMAAMPRPPRMWPTNDAAARNSERLKPPCVANWPISRKSGITLRSYTVRRATAEPLSVFSSARSFVITQ